MASVRIGRHPTPQAQGRVVNERRTMTRLLEGRYRWGDFRTGTGRSGWITYRLTVYPPGIDSGERRALQFWYSWPLAGAVLAILCFSVLGGLLSPGVLVPAVAVGYAAGVVAGWAATRRVRPRVRRLNVARFPENGSIQTLGDLAVLRRCVDALDHLDAGLTAGRITPLEYEHGWWSVYESVATVDREAHHTRSV